MGQLRDEHRLALRRVDTGFGHRGIEVRCDRLGPAGTELRHDLLQLGRGDAVGIAGGRRSGHTVRPRDRAGAVGHVATGPTRVAGVAAATVPARNGDPVAGIDHVRVGHLRIGGEDLAEGDAVTGRDARQGVAGAHRVTVRGRQRYPVARIDDVRIEDLRVRRQQLAQRHAEADGDRRQGVTVLDGHRADGAGLGTAQTGMLTEGGDRVHRRVLVGRDVAIPVDTACRGPIQLGLTLIPCAQRGVFAGMRKHPA